MRLLRGARRHLSSSATRYDTHSPKLTIGIRKEDPARVWERRCPLTPDAVHRLVKEENVKVLVEDCERYWRVIKEAIAGKAIATASTAIAIEVQSSDEQADTDEKESDLREARSAA